MIDKARLFARKAHMDTNHYYYDNKPYFHHLERIHDVALHYIDAVPMSAQENVLAATYLVDTMNAARVEYSELKSTFNSKVADLVYTVTPNKYKSRKEKNDNEYYYEIKKLRYALFILMAKRIATIRYAIDRGRFDIVRMYKHEFPNFKNYIKDSTTDMYNSAAMFSDYEMLLN